MTRGSLKTSTILGLGLPSASAGQAGIGYSGDVGVNLGGPVNRVGVR